MGSYFFGHAKNTTTIMEGVWINMFKTKSKKMREVVERQLWLIDSQLKKYNDELDHTGVVYQTRIAQKVTVEEILRAFDNIES